MIPHCQPLDQVITGNTFRSSYMDGDTEVPLRLAKELLSKAALVLGRREEFLDVTGSGYNAFEALCLFYEKFHSRMIGSLLSSESHHGLGSLFLKRFFETVFPDFEIENRRVSVTTEKYIGPIPNDHESGGIIDILLETDEWMVAIENKVDESARNNQPKQLYRYWNWVKARGRDFALVYLTPTGKTAPEGSTSGKGRKLEAGKGKDYICLSYTQIASWIDACIRDSVRFPRIREILIQYRDFLDQNVLPSRNGDKYMTEIEQLIENGFFSVATAIAKALPNARANATGALLKKVFNDKTIPGTNAQKGSLEDWKRFADPTSSTCDNPCYLFSVSFRKRGKLALALAWEGSQPGIGICVDKESFEFGKELHCRFMNQQWNKDATDWWPCWIWLDQVHLDASFFDMKKDQKQFCDDLDAKFNILCECIRKVAKDFVSEETT